MRETYGDYLEAMRAQQVEPMSREAWIEAQRLCAEEWWNTPIEDLEDDDE